MRMKVLMHSLKNAILIGGAAEEYMKEVRILNKNVPDDLLKLDLLQSLLLSDMRTEIAEDQLTFNKLSNLKIKLANS